jgi:hypothetical protein
MAAWRACASCGTDNPEEFVRCVRCQERLPGRGGESVAWLATREIPANPQREEIDFDRDGRTYVVVFLIRMKDEWYRLEREMIVAMNRAHMQLLAPYAALVRREMLRCEGLARYDYVELIEADDLKLINSLMRTVKSSEKGRFMEVVDAVVTVKGLSLYSPDAADCLPAKAD